MINLKLSVYTTFFQTIIIIFSKVPNETSFGFEDTRFGSVRVRFYLHLLFQHGIVARRWVAETSSATGFCPSFVCLRRNLIWSNNSQLRRQIATGHKNCMHCGQIRTKTPSAAALTYGNGQHQCSASWTDHYRASPVHALLLAINDSTRPAAETETWKNDWSSPVNDCLNLL